jgi:peptidyl-prolyl cis-trans isomerase C
VSVNGVAISREAISREAQHHPAKTPLDAWKAAAQALAIRQLLLQEARRLAIPALPQSDGAGRRESDEEAMVRGLIEREIVTPEPDEETCRRFYLKNVQRFRSPAIYEAAHILFAARKDDAPAYAEAQRQASVVLTELQAHPERFAELAAAHSACPSGAQGGNLGQITCGQTTPEFEHALFALAPGCIGDALVLTRYGVHIIRLDRRIEGRLLPFELVAGRIADYLRDSVTCRATAQYIARLVSRAQITGVALAGAAEHRVN